MSNPYAGHASSLTAPFAHLVDVEIGTDFTQPCRGLYVGGAGDVSILMIDGSTAICRNVPAGAILPVRATRVETSGTTATDIVAGW